MKRFVIISVKYEISSLSSVAFFERVLVCIVVATGFVAVPEAASAQSNDGSYADVTVQSMVKFPGDDVDLSVLDGNILLIRPRCCSMCVGRTVR